jgi:hypothetical protein
LVIHPEDTLHHSESPEDAQESFTNDNFLPYGDITGTRVLVAIGLQIATPGAVEIPEGNRNKFEGFFLTT